jgi:hypothetical protein
LPFFVRPSISGALGVHAQIALREQHVSGGDDDLVVAVVRDRVGVERRVVADR